MASHTTNDCAERGAMLFIRWAQKILYIEKIGCEDELCCTLRTWRSRCKKSCVQNLTVSTLSGTYFEKKRGVYRTHLSRAIFNFKPYVVVVYQRIFSESKLWRLSQELNKKDLFYPTFTIHDYVGAAYYALGPSLLAAFLKISRKMKKKSIRF